MPVIMSDTVLEPKPPNLSSGDRYCGQTGVPPVVDRRQACVVTVDVVVAEGLRLWGSNYAGWMRDSMGQNNWHDLYAHYNDHNISLNKPNHVLIFTNCAYALTTAP